MIDYIDYEFDEESPQEIASVLVDAYDLNLAKSELVRELEKANRSGIEINQAVKVLLTAHSASRSDPWISDIYGVGIVRACRLLQAGYTDLEAIANANRGSLAEIHGISGDFATVFIEHAQELIGNRELTAQAVASATSRSKEQIEKDLGSLGASGVPPSQAEQFLLAHHERDPPRLTDINRVDTRVAYFLTEAEFERPEDVASASVTDLTGVRYIGDSNAETIQDSAQEIVEKSGSDSVSDPSVSSSTVQSHNDEQVTRQSKTDAQLRQGDKSYDVACFGGLTPFELVQNPDICREIVERIADEVATLDVDCVFYTGTREAPIDTVGMDFSTAVEATVELLSEAEFEAPVGFVLGKYDAYGTSIEATGATVSEYAEHPPLQQTGFPQLPEGVQYVPTDKTVHIGDLPVTQNPNLADDTTLLLSHQRYPTQKKEYTALATISGAGIHGSYNENDLNTIAVSYDPGPSNEVVSGGYHVLTIASTGIQREVFQRLGRVGQLECWEHTTKGQQYIHGPTECPYCENADIDDETDLTDPLPNQEPTETTWASHHIASSQLALTIGDLDTYFSAYDVLRPAKTSQRDIPTDSSTEQQIDEEALEAGLLQGEWILSCDPEAVDSVWQQVKSLVAEGELYDARVSTKLRVALRDSERYYISVAVPNYFDRDDVARVRTAIRESDIDPSGVFFKPLIYSKWRITSDTKHTFSLDRTTRYRDLA